jgi:hypothetical protein
MIQKHYNDDWAKSRSRDLVRGMIEDTVLQYRKPSQVTVLCFPGVDATEIEEVYDPLGISRENIIGLERDPEIASEIESRGLGIQVVPEEFGDYVARRNKLQLDVVSLDYTGSLTIAELDDLRKLRKQNKKKQFLLHVANLMKRDRKSTGLYFNGKLLGSQKDDDVPFPTSNYDTIDAMVTDANTKLFEGGSFAEMKRNFYALVIAHTLSGKTKESDSQLFKWLMGRDYESALTEFEEETGCVIENRDNPFASICQAPSLEAKLHDFVTGKFRKKCATSSVPFSDEPVSDEIWHGLHHAIKNGIVGNDVFLPTKNNASYSYISESGAPMVGMVALMRHPRKLKISADRLLKEVGYPHTFDLSRISDMFIPRLLGYLGEVKALDTPLKTDWHEPIFLGSSAKPVLTKAKAIEEFKEGATIKDVRSKYRGVKDKPLAAWLAHTTMGTYDEKVNVDEDEGVEIITKEEALELLMEGIPPKEIAAAYPKVDAGNFTMGQLRAFKAHQTMGTYK